MKNETPTVMETALMSRARRPRASLVARVLALAFPALGAIAFAGCSSTTREPGTGETHFLASCTTSCADGLSCICGACSKPCGEDAACGAFPGTATCETSTCGGGSSCDVTCTKDEDCAGVSGAPHCSGGRCRATTNVTPDGGTEPRTDAGGGSHDFDHCAHQPPSVCTKEETCKQLGCGGTEFESDGCMRTPCTDDGACGADERCTAVQCINTSACTYQSGGQCGCGGVTSCTAGAFCNPLADVGQKGDFQTIEVRAGGGPCPPGSVCTSWWKISADGGLSASKSGEPITSQLSDPDLRELLLLVNGPDLRKALKDGIACDPPPTDVGETIILTLSSGVLQQDVTGCIYSGPAGNVFQQVDTIAKRY